MIYDERLAERVRALLPESATERRMFGGLAFMVSGHLCCSVTGDGLLVRVENGDRHELAARPHVRPMVMGKRVMTGYLRVGPTALSSDEGLSVWVDRALAAVAALGSRER